MGEVLVFSGVKKKSMFFSSFRHAGCWFLGKGKEYKMMREKMVFGMLLVLSLTLPLFMGCQYQGDCTIRARNPIIDPTPPEEGGMHPWISERGF